MPRAVPPFDEYLASLGSLKTHVDPTISTPETEDIKRAYYTLGAIETLSVEALTAWVQANPQWVPVLGLTVGLGQERLKNELKHRFDTSGWITLARQRPAELIQWLDNEFRLVDLLSVQRFADYNFADILVERAGTRVTATQAGKSGRRVEDLIETIADGLELPYQTRTRFTGRNNQTAPCDLVVPNSSDAQIVVAAKGFNSTGSKLSDAVREIQEMANVRKPTQFVMAVIDGIGWKSRVSDLRRIHQLWVDGSIDGMYTLATLNVFRDDLEEAARLRRFI